MGGDCGTGWSGWEKIEGRVGFDMLSEADAAWRCSLMGDPRLMVQERSRVRRLEQVTRVGGGS